MNLDLTPKKKTYIEDEFDYKETKVMRNKTKSRFKTEEIEVVRKKLFDNEMEEEVC